MTGIDTDDREWQAAPAGGGELTDTGLLRLLVLSLAVSASPWTAAARSVPWQVYAPADTAGLPLLGLQASPCSPGRKLLTATYGKLGEKTVAISEGQTLCAGENFGHNRWLLVHSLHGIRVRIGAGCYRSGGDCRMSDGVRHGYWVLWTEPGRRPVRILVVSSGLRFATVWRFVTGMRPIRRA